MFSGKVNGLKPHGTTLAIHIPGTLFGSVAHCYKKSPKNRVTSVKEKHNSNGYGNVVKQKA